MQKSSRGKKKVIKKNELKMIYYSGLHRQGMPIVGQGFAYSARSTSAGKNMEILSWVISEKPSMPNLACQYFIILLWHQVSQKAQMTPNFSTSSLTCFSFFLLSVWEHIIKHNGPNGVLPSLFLLPPPAEEACDFHISERKDDNIGRTNNMVS